MLINQYAELTKNGRNGKSAHLNTILLMTATLFIYFFCIFYLIDLTTGGSITNLLSNSALSGKAMGQLFAAMSGAIIYIVVIFCRDR